MAVATTVDFGVPERAPDYELRVPVGKGWITANQRHHWRTRARLTKEWRACAALVARSQRVPPIPGRVYIVATLHFANRLRRDPNNWAPTAKAAVDGLVDAKVLEDDSARYVVGPDMRLGEVTTELAMVLSIWHLS